MERRTGPRSSGMLGRLSDVSEAAIQRLATVPGADQFLGAANALREQIDELQRRIRGLDDLERRVEALERRLDAASAMPAAPALARPDRRTPPLTNVSGGTPRRPAQPAQAPAPPEPALPAVPPPAAATPPPPDPPVPPAATLPPTVGGSTEPAGGASPG